MRHPCGAPPLGLRFSVDGKTVAYTGDTEWNEDIVQLGQAADLFVIECLFFEKTVPHHLNYRQIQANAARIGARRNVLTHFGPEMEARRDEVTGFEIASDGLILDV
jgi:ribonuclease BN (tRNA processing enzyme)